MLWVVLVATVVWTFDVFGSIGWQTVFFICLSCSKINVFCINQLDAAVHLVKYYYNILNTRQELFPPSTRALTPLWTSSSQLDCCASLTLSITFLQHPLAMSHANNEALHCPSASFEPSYTASWYLQSLYRAGWLIYSLRGPAVAYLGRRLGITPPLPLPSFQLLYLASASQFLAIIGFLTLALTLEPNPGLWLFLGLNLIEPRCVSGHLSCTSFTIGFSYDNAQSTTPELPAVHTFTYGHLFISCTNVERRQQQQPDAAGHVPFNGPPNTVCCRHPGPIHGQHTRRQRLVFGTASSVPKHRRITAVCVGAASTASPPA